MKAKLLHSLVIVILFIIIPAASMAQKPNKKQLRDQQKAARAICSVVGKIVQSDTGLMAFDAIKGGRDYDASNNQWVVYDAGIYLPGANTCRIYTDRVTGQSSYMSCSFTKPGDVASTEQALLQWEHTIVSTFDPCLPKSWKPIDDRRQHPAGYILRGEGDPGQKIEIQFVSDDSGKVRELQVNFYPK